MNSKLGIEKIIRQHKKELIEKYKIKRIGIFGSYVRGNQKKRSDIDILVDYREIPDLLKFIELERHLEKLLKKKVDLVEKTSIRPQLKEVILGEVLYI